MNSIQLLLLVILALAWMLHRYQWTILPRTYVIRAIYEHPFDGWEQKFTVCVHAHSLAQARRRFWVQEKAEGNATQCTKIQEISPYVPSNRSCPITAII